MHYHYTTTPISCIGMKNPDLKIRNVNDQQYMRKKGDSNTQNVKH